MSWKNPREILLLVIVLFVFFSTNPASADATISSKRKLDEGNPVTPGSSDLGIKCGPCDNPSPRPPPPSLPPPPPPPKSPSKVNCPPPPGLPPPPPAFNYISGPPGELYPIDYSGADHLVIHTIHVGKWMIFMLGLMLVFA